MSENNLGTSFEKLLGRQPSDVEVQNLYKVKDALSLKDNDAMWLILMALQHHQTLYDKIPGLINKTAKDALTNVKATADASIKASAEEAKYELSKAVSAAAQQVASETAIKEKWKWVTACLLGAFIAFSLFGYVIYFFTKQSATEYGYALAYQKAKDEKAAAAWGNTPEGQLAYSFYRRGNLTNLAGCNLPGWKIENGVCYVHPTKDGSTYGWRIP